jgi:hypothetical protein
MSFRYRVFGEKALRPRQGRGRSVSGGDDIHKGPHATSLPLPPLRGRSRFPGMFARNLYLKDSRCAPFLEGDI